MSGRKKTGASRTSRTSKASRASGAVKSRIEGSTYFKKAMAAVGIFALGSAVGAKLDSVPAYFEITPPTTVTETTAPETNVPETTVQKPETVPETTAPTVAEPPTVPEAPPVTETPSTSTEAPSTTTEAPSTSPEPSSTSTEAPPVTEAPSATAEAPENDDWMESNVLYTPLVPNTSESGATSAPTDTEQATVVPEAPTATDTSWFEEGSTGSSMTDELAGLLENVAVFWSSGGQKLHLDPSCPTLGEVRYAGTLEEGQSVRSGGWCMRCAEHLSGEENSVFYVKGNVLATYESLIASYTYSDCKNGIPN